MAVTWTPMGRAGNFFFTFATCFAYAKKHGLKFSVPRNTSSHFWSPVYCQHLMDPNYDISLPNVTITEKQFHYVPLPFDEAWRHANITFQGYFQSPLYFDEYREDILNAIGFKWELKPDICSIHARYGDYLTIAGKHIIIDEPYLLKAMAIITEKTGITKFKVFSDDLPLFKERHGHLSDFEYSTNTDIIDDLREISCCHSNINSSSTFSWWGAYLNRNPDKVVITQSEWFQKNWDNADTSTILPNEWIKI